MKKTDILVDSGGQVNVISETYHNHLNASQKAPVLAVIGLSVAVAVGEKRKG